MNLDELYSIHSTPKTKSNNLFKLYIVIAFIAIISFSVARYSIGGNVNITANIAKFNVEINDVNMDIQNEAIEDRLQIVIDDNEYNDNILRCGQRGHFDIKINPLDTETDLRYNINIIKAYLPEGFIIYEYSLNDFTRRYSVMDSSVEGEILLEGRESYDESDIKVYRFYFIWNSEYCIDISDYRIKVETVIEQKIS
ncbi:MAG: hypothetical protein IJ809_01705 [Clostridia bacterium]|nr:hypothetical protein [Clostridia bacterium]